MEVTETEKKSIFLDFAIKYYEDINHPLGVANKFKTLSDEWIVGLYHDLLEDTEVKKETLLSFLKEHKKEYLLLDIEVVTRKDSETYFEYIQRIKEYGGIAVKVKIADLLFNLSRTSTLKPSLEKRYRKALSLLVDF